MLPRLLSVPLAVLVFALSAGQALASTSYFVQGTSDSPLAACQPIPDVPNAARCNTLRAAVDAANATPSGSDAPDVIFLQAAGVYALTQGTELALTDSVTIIGRGARTTTVRAVTSRVFSVAAGVEANFYRFTIAGGNPGDSIGGNVNNLGGVFMYRMRVTEGNATMGAGIANAGHLYVFNSLIDQNATVSNGGGIYSVGSAGAPASLALFSTTVAFNSGSTGAGIYTSGPNDNTLDGITVAHNSTTDSIAGIAADEENPTTIRGSIVTANNGSNCRGGLTEANAPGTNREDGTTTCAFSNSSGTIGLAAALSNEGGDTDVLTIAPTGSAKRAVTPCLWAFDQRDAAREASGTCDAGAYEEGAVAPAIDDSAMPEPLPPVIPTPTPTPPAPTPTPTATATPTPIPSGSVGVVPVRGKVLIRRNGKFVALTEGVIRSGSEVDTRKGTVEITTAAGDKATFHDGIFKLSQSKGLTTLTLSQKLTGCPKGRRAARAAAAKPKSRKLWGNGKGKFRTKGQYGAATIRGTEWLVTDTCTTTSVRVKQGVVSFRDDVKKKTFVVRKGKTKTARKKP